MKESECPIKYETYNLNHNLMLRTLRIIIAAVFFIGITLLFLDFTGALHLWLGWMAKIQFLPAVLAMNTIVSAILLIITIIFGRVYCSTICPLGVMQDIISWIHGKTKKKNRFRFSYAPAKNWLRYPILVLFIIGLAVGGHSIAILIAPYSAYGRIASNLFAPLYQWGNNLLAWLAERAGSYAFYSTEVWIKSMPTFIIAASTFIIIFIIAWKGGRTYCNTVCPVGTILGFFSRHSMLAPVIDTEKCRNCQLCSRQCKASCIDVSNHTIDYSRCVACMDCIDTCKDGAISYTWRYGRKSCGKTTVMPAAQDSANDRNSIDKGRRAFMISSALATSAAIAKAQEIKGDGGLTDVSHAQKPQRKVSPVPAGAISLKNFTDHCTGCQLCVSICPNQVLRPSVSLNKLMLPEMSYERGYCRPECTKCSDVCPAGAIRPITVEEKSSIQIGHAVVDYEACVVNTDNVKCGNCARHCPAGAITMVRIDPDKEDSPRIPAVNEEKCIGCGACESLCPARPVTAIHVEGHEVHKTI